MAILARLMDLFAGKPEPEQKINDLLMAFCDPYDDLTQLEQATAECLVRLKAVAASHSSVKVWVDRISHACAPSHQWSEYDMLAIHQVAVGNAIIALLGYYAGSAADLDPEAAAAMRHSCEAQRSRVDLGRIDRPRLRQVLFQTSEIKKFWDNRRWATLPGDIPEDRRYSVTVVTPPEAQARAELAQELRAR